MIYLPTTAIEISSSQMITWVCNLYSLSNSMPFEIPKTNVNVCSFFKQINFISIYKTIKLFRDTVEATLDLWLKCYVSKYFAVKNLWKAFHGQKRSRKLDSDCSPIGRRDVTWWWETTNQNSLSGPSYYKPSLKSLLTMVSTYCFIFWNCFWPP